MKYEYLNDSSFLKSLNKTKIRKYYFKAISLNFVDEQELEAVEGVVKSGSINVDGSSAVRRTASLSVYCDTKEKNIQYFNKFFNIARKIKLEIGLANNTKQYTDYNILWFPMGVYVITGVSFSQDTGSGISATVQLQDKMCLLNGEYGGTIPAATDLDCLETVDTTTGKVITTKITIFQLIQELVNHFGGEQLGKIIISDVDSVAKQVVQWNKSAPLYVVDNGENDEDSNEIKKYTMTTSKPSNESTILKTYNCGDYIGYTYTDFVYPSSDYFSVNIGETVVSALNKIKNTLGNYEYFYDLDGNFVWQEIKDYQNTSKASVDLQNSDNADYLLDISGGNSAFSFDDSSIITSFSNAPQYNQIKNDFVIWGTRKEGSGDDAIEKVIRYHLAIDNRPYVKYTSIAEQYNKYVSKYKDSYDAYYNTLLDIQKEAVREEIRKDIDSFLINIINKLNNYLETSSYKTQEEIITIIKNYITTFENYKNLDIDNFKETYNSFKKDLYNLVVAYSKNKESLETAQSKAYEDRSIYRGKLNSHFEKQYIETVLVITGIDLYKFNPSSYEQLYDKLKAFQKDKNTVIDLTSGEGDITLFNTIIDIYEYNRIEVVIKQLDEQLEKNYAELQTYNYVYNSCLDYDYNSSLKDLIYDYYIIDFTSDLTDEEIKDIQENYLYMLFKDSEGNLYVPKTYDAYKDFPLIGEENQYYYDKKESNCYTFDSENGYQITYELDQIQIFASDWRTQLYLEMKGQYAQETNVYYEELANEWSKLYDVIGISINNYSEVIYTGVLKNSVIEESSNIDYFLDIIDSGTDFFNQINVSNIGRRSYVKKVDEVNCIFSPETTDWIILDSSEDNTKYKEICKNNYQSYIEIDGNIYENCISVNDSYYSAYDEIKSILNTYTSYNSSITLVCLPIFYLEPNIRITVRNTDLDIYGDYILKNYSIQLGNNNTMNMSCNQVIETI
jgi:hypothetical protein